MKHLFLSEPSCSLAWQDAVEKNQLRIISLPASDVTANYPEKDLILQDFMDVDYVPLETSDEFVASGKIAYIGDKLIVSTNLREGDILLFDRATGKGVRKINRRGQGPEEYIMPFNVVLYEDQNEMFVNDGPSSKIQVYDLEGNYKRTISYKKGALISILIDFDENNFLSQNIYAPQNEGSGETFLFLSKKDGSMTDIKVPYQKRLSVALIKEHADGSIQGALRRMRILSTCPGWLGIDGAVGRYDLSV